MLIENYLYQTKVTLTESFPKLYEKPNNISAKQRQSLQQLGRMRHITIKPANKNLGIVILNTEDYVQQIIAHLSSDTYRMADHFPVNLSKLIENIIIAFKNEINGYSKRIYNFLLPKQKHRIPKLYGIPKIHKACTPTGVPPLRPIISHNDSILSHSAQFIDHVLQPLARVYPDYIPAQFHLTDPYIVRLGNTIKFTSCQHGCHKLISIYPPDRMFRNHLPRNGKPLRTPPIRSQINNTTPANERPE